MSIDLKKVKTNIEYLIDLTSKSNIKLTAITKLFGCDENLIELFEKYPQITSYGDSRIDNLKKLSRSQKEKILIRLPMPAEIKEVIEFADTSFNSEISTIKLLSSQAQIQNKIHNVVLMVDLGDLREGIFDESELLATVAEVLVLKNIRLKGLAVNLMCFGGIVPDEVNLGRLCELASLIETTFNIKLDIISGGNSSSLYLLASDFPNKTMPSKVNNLRIGDAFFTGETSFSYQFPETRRGSFKFLAQIVELKQKPSFPVGEISVDAFGNIPIFEDKGMRLKGILAVGRQDIVVDGLIPIDDKLKILGASSDHLMLDFTDSEKVYTVGDIITFEMHYAAVLQAFTSNYVHKEYLENKIRTIHVLNEPVGATEYMKKQISTKIKQVDYNDKIRASKKNSGVKIS